MLQCYERVHTITWKNLCQTFSCVKFSLKYFCGSWQLTIIKHTKCILYTNIRAFDFHGSPVPRKYFNNEYSGTFVMRTPLGHTQSVLIRRYPDFRGCLIYL